MFDAALVFASAALITVGSVDRNDSVELDSDDELSPVKNFLVNSDVVAFDLGGSSNVSSTLADVIGVR